MKNMNNHGEKFEDEDVIYPLASDGHRRFSALDMDPEWVALPKMIKTVLSHLWLITTTDILLFL